MSSVFAKQALAAARELRESDFQEAFSLLEEEEKKQVIAQIASELGESHPFVKTAGAPLPQTTKRKKERQLPREAKTKKTKQEPTPSPLPQEEPPPIGTQQEEKSKYAIRSRDFYLMSLPAVRNLLLSRLQAFAKTRNERLALRAEAMKLGNLAGLTQTQIHAEPLSEGEKASITIQVGALPEWLVQLREAGISVPPSQAIRHLEEGIGMEVSMHLRSLKGQVISKEANLPAPLTVSDVQIHRENEGEWVIELRGEINDAEGTVKGIKNIFYRFPIHIRPLRKWEQTEQQIAPLAGWEATNASKTPLGRLFSAVLTHAEAISAQASMKTQESTSVPILHTTRKYRANLTPEKYYDLLGVLTLHQQFGIDENEAVKFEIQESGIRFQATFPHDIQSEGETLHTELQTIQVDVPAPRKENAPAKATISTAKRMLGMTLVTLGNLLPAMTMGAVGFGFPLIGKGLKKMTDVGLSLLVGESESVGKLKESIRGRMETLPISHEQKRRKGRGIQRAFLWLAGETEDYIRKLVKEENVNAELRGLLTNIKTTIDKAYGDADVGDSLGKAQPTYRRKILHTLLRYPVGLSAHPAYSSLLELAAVAYARAGHEEKKTLGELIHLLAIGVALIPKAIVPYMLAKDIREANLQSLLSEIADTVMPEHSPEERAAWRNKAYARVDEMLKTPHLRIVLSSGRSLHIRREGEGITVRLGATEPPEQAVREVLGNTGHIPHTGLVGIGAMSPQQPTEISSFAGAVYATIPFAIRELFAPHVRMQKGSLRMSGELLSNGVQGLVEMQMDVPVSAEQEEQMVRFVLTEDLRKASSYVIKQMTLSLRNALSSASDNMTATAITTAMDKMFAAGQAIDPAGVVSAWHMWGASFESVDNMKTLAAAYLANVNSNDRDTADLLLVRAAGRVGNPNEKDISNAVAMAILSLFRVGYPFRKTGQGFASVPHIAHLVVSLASGGIESLYKMLANSADEETKRKLQEEAKAVTLWLHGQMLPKNEEKVAIDISIPATISMLSKDNTCYETLTLASKQSPLPLESFREMSEKEKTRHVLSLLTHFINAFAEIFFLREYASYDNLSKKPAQDLLPYPLTAWRVAWKKAWQGKGNREEALSLWNTFPRLALSEMFAIVHLAAEAKILPQEEEHAIEDTLRQMARHADSQQMPDSFPELLRNVYGADGLLALLQKGTGNLRYTGFVNHPNGLNAFFIKMTPEGRQTSTYHLALPFDTEVILTIPEVHIFHPHLVGCVGMGYKSTSYVRSLYARFDFQTDDTIPLGYDAPVDQQIYRSIATHATSDAYVSMPSVGGIPAEYIPRVSAEVRTGAETHNVTPLVQAWLKRVYDFHELGRNAFREVFLLAGAQNAHLLWHEDEIAEKIKQTEVGAKYPVLVETIREDFCAIRQAFTNLHLEVEKVRLANYEQAEAEKLLQSAWDKVLALRVHPLSHLLFHHALYEMAQASQRNPFFAERSTSLAKSDIDALRPVLMQIAQSREIPLRLLNASVELLSAFQKADEESIKNSIENLIHGLPDEQVGQRIRDVVGAVYARAKEQPVYSTISYRIDTER